MVNGNVSWNWDLLHAVCIASNGSLALVFSFTYFLILVLKREMGTLGMKRSKFSCSSSLNHHHLLLLLLGFLFSLLQTVAVESTTLNFTRYRQVSSLRLQRIQRHLDKINKPPVLTIQVIIYLETLWSSWPTNTTQYSLSYETSEVIRGWY